MKKIISLSSLLFASVLTTSAANAFSNANFNGGYAFRLVGTSSLVLANQPRTVATGVLVADGNGHVTGHGSFRSAGATCIGTISGAYHLNPNGTGTLSSVIHTSTPGCVTSVLDLALSLANNGARFEAANTENDYMSGTFTRQDKTTFTQKDLTGTYALRLEGPSSVAKASEPYTVGVGILTANGKGNITGTGTLRSAGATCQGSFSGNYHLAQDGTGSISTNFTTSSPGCFTSVVDFSVALYQKGLSAEVANSESDYMAGSLTHQ